jgi:hypothetical protein
MKSLLNALAVCLVAGAVSVGAQQQQQTPPPQPPEQPQVSLTGCLTQGSMPTVFILENAKAATGTTQETATRYVVVAEAKDVDLLAHLNNEVTLKGATEGAIPPPEKPVEEKDLPKLRVQTLAVVSNTCATR